MERRFYKRVETTATVIALFTIYELVFMRQIWRGTTLKHAQRAISEKFQSRWDQSVMIIYILTVSVLEKETEKIKFHILFIRQ